MKIFTMRNIIIAAAIAALLYWWMQKKKQDQSAGGAALNNARGGAPAPMQVGITPAMANQLTGTTTAIGATFNAPVHGQPSWNELAFLTGGAVGRSPVQGHGI